jgi:hypothetical protein
MSNAYQEVDRDRPLALLGLAYVVGRDVRPHAEGTLAQASLLSKVLQPGSQSRFHHLLQAPNLRLIRSRRRTLQRCAPRSSSYSHAGFQVHHYRWLYSLHYGSLPRQPECDDQLSTARIQEFKGFKDSALLRHCIYSAKHLDSRPMGRQSRPMGRSPPTHWASVPTFGARLPTDGAVSNCQTSDVDPTQRSGIWP